MKTFNENLIKILKEKRITQTQLANYLEYSKVAINHWTKGESQPSIESLIKIANLLNVSLDYLLTGEEKNEKIINIKINDYNEIEQKTKEIIEILKRNK